MTPVWLWDCDGGPAQIWTVKANGTIVNNHSGLCLADKGGGTADGNPIWVYTCDGGPAQLWQVPMSSADPSGQSMPVGDLPGWHQIFTDNFADPGTAGQLPVGRGQQVDRLQRLSRHHRATASTTRPRSSASPTA